MTFTRGGIVSEVTMSKSSSDVGELFELKHRDRAELRAIRLSDIDVPNSESFDLHELTALGDSIRRVGLIDKPTVLRDGKRFTVVVGRRRIAAMQLLATIDHTLTEVDCFVREHRTTTESDVAKLVLTENARRSANILAELESINVLLKQDRMSIEGVARSIGQNTPWVKRRLVLNKLLPKFLGEMAKGHLKFETASTIAKLDRSQQQRVWEAFAEKRKDDADAVITAKDVAATLSCSTAPLPKELFSKIPPVDPPSAAIQAALADLLRSADDTGCTDDLVVVSKAALRRLEEAVG